jgi:hypothetical protein
MRHISAPVVAGLTAALATACLLAPSSAGAKTNLVELRVEGAQKTIEPGAWYAVTSQRIKRATAADECVPRSGATLFQGVNALTALGSAEDANSAVRPVRYRGTDLGPQVCQIKNRKSFGHYPNASGGFLYWVDYVSGFSSPDVASLENGQSLLWYEAIFPSDPPQVGQPVRNIDLVLELRGVPPRDADGEFVARVVEHGFDGTPSPVSDATIVGAESVNPIGEGRYEVTVGNGASVLYADHQPDVRSNQVETCSRAKLAACPKAHGRTIYGSDRADDLKGTRGFDEIAAGGGDDALDLRKGGRDRANCGAGDDVVRLRRGDGDDRIRGNCERVRRS